MLYGKTIDHVLELEVVFADGSVARLGSGGDVPECFRTVLDLAAEHADEIDCRFPKVLRRVGGYNLDEFVPGREPFNLAKMIVGSEGTLAVILEAKLNLRCGCRKRRPFWWCSSGNCWKRWPSDTVDPASYIRLRRLK